MVRVMHEAIDGSPVKMDLNLFHSRETAVGDVEDAVRKMLIEKFYRETPPAVREHLFNKRNIIVDVVAGCVYIIFSFPAPISLPEDHWIHRLHDHITPSDTKRMLPNFHLATDAV